MNQFVTFLAIFCLTQTAAATDAFVKCFDHQGNAIFKGVLMNRYINANGIGGGIVLAGRSKIAAQAYSISQRKASELGIQSAYKCNFPFLKVYESTSEKVTLACAAAEITELITHIPEDESKDLNQISVRERLAGANGFPECTMVIPPEKMDLIRARINSGK